jgi:methylase of polypeptide subunit release factors
MNSHGATMSAIPSNEPVDPDNLHLRELVAEIERRHAELTSTQRITLHGYAFDVDPGVFHPAFSQVGDLLASHLMIAPGATVLDLGTGTGFLAVVAAGLGSRVLALDRQLEAVSCARRNAELNGLQAKVEVRQSDLFAAVAATETFDVIIANFPFVPWSPETDWQRHNFDAGHQGLKQLLKQAKLHLRPGGRIFLTWSDLGDTDYFFTLMAQENYVCRKVATRKQGEIGFYVYELMP